MAKFKKGVSGNPNGRPKGSVNKTTSDMKDILNQALFGDADSIREDMAKLEPRDRLMLKAKFAPFILPTLKAVDNNITTGKDTSLGFTIEYKDEMKEDEEE
jgi:hypothetical protein